MYIYYIPCPDQNTAQNIAQQCLELGLIGCANILPGVQSIYRWQNKIETAQEFILILKTSDSNDVRDRLEMQIKKMHPYDTPCLMGFKPDSINGTYRDWLYENLKF